MHSRKEGGIMKSQFVIASALLLLTVSVGCDRARKYSLRGEVVARNAASSEITVNHGDIPGFMAAMAIPYRVKDPAVIQELQPGDKIAAEVVVGKDPSDIGWKTCALPMNLGVAR